MPPPPLVAPLLAPARHQLHAGPAGSISYAIRPSALLLRRRSLWMNHRRTHTCASLRHRSLLPSARPFCRTWPGGCAGSSSATARSRRAAREAQAAIRKAAAVAAGVSTSHRERWPGPRANRKAAHALAGPPLIISRATTASLASRERVMRGTSVAALHRVVILLFAGCPLIGPERRFTRAPCVVLYAARSWFESEKVRAR